MGECDACELAVEIVATMVSVTSPMPLSLPPFFLTGTHRHSQTKPGHLLANLEDAGPTAGSDAGDRAVLRLEQRRPQTPAGRGSGIGGRRGNTKRDDRHGMRGRPPCTAPRDRRKGNTR